MKLKISIFNLDLFHVVQYCCENMILAEKVIFENSDNIGFDECSMFHDESSMEKTYWVRQNEIVNIFKTKPKNTISWRICL